jgi:8-oxo-dGTP pyrophosphatase MutT (NUDIX family)
MDRFPASQQTTEANSSITLISRQRIILGITAVILSDDGRRILLHRRSDNLLWSLPGGSAEFGEKIEISCPAR